MNSEYGTYLVTQADRSAGRSTPEVVEAAIAGGVNACVTRYVPYSEFIGDTSRS